MTNFDARLEQFAKTDKSLRRHLENADRLRGMRVRIGTRELINFSSNDYLGLSAHPAVKEAAISAIDEHGVGSGAAALLSGRHRLHEALERELAAYVGSEAALIYSSGYLANLGVIGALVRRHDHVFQDRLNHASLIDAASLSKAKSIRYAHNDVNALKNELEATPPSRRWIITDALFSMDGDTAPLLELSRLASEYDADLMVDDAHGFGVLGGGRGSVVAAGLDPHSIPVQIVTFGKALGTAGAAVLGSARLIETLIQSSRTFIYDTAPPPALCAATSAALALLRQDPKIHRELETNIRVFKSLASELPISDSQSPIQPVLIGDSERALKIASSLSASGFYARAVRPPTVPKGTARLRLCISAAHKRAEIEGLVGALHNALDANQ